MLLSVNSKTLISEKIPGKRLFDFGIDERKLQDVLFRSLDRLFPDDELILLMQSQYWREEPDLMAIDKEGKLYIFELKAWESNSENLLQVMRYGQIFGGSTYNDLNSMYRKRADNNQTLSQAHKIKFGVDLPESNFNNKQVFIVMTNGLDYKTREAIQYWKFCGLDVRPWVYRIYNGNSNDEMLLELSAYRVEDNPYEDFAEGYYILNTNFSNDPQDHHDMLQHKKAAAYYDPWKYNIARLKKGDVVFLYQSGVGIVAIGDADGKLLKTAHQGNPSHQDEEYYMKLNNFKLVNPPITASEIKKLNGVNYVFMRTMFGIDSENGKNLRKYILEKLSG
jgi:hypothetical protein